MNFPKVVQSAVDELSRLPGMGERSAVRIVFWLLTRPRDQIKRLAMSLLALSESSVICSVCGNISDIDPCSLCRDTERQADLLCVVQQVSDMLTIERSGAFRGYYHVLGGVIDPMNDVHPEDLKIESLIDRVKQGTIKEVIIATDPNAEGNITANYIKGLLSDYDVTVSRPAQGVSYGSGITYANDRSLREAFNNRIKD
jgi:recombination protein RecR